MLYQNKDLLELVNREAEKIAHSVPVTQFYEGFSKLKIKQKNAIKQRPFSSSTHAQGKKRLQPTVSELPWASNLILKPNKDLETKKVILRSTKISQSWHCERNTVSPNKTGPAMKEKQPPIFFNSLLNQVIISQDRKQHKVSMKSKKDYKNFAWLAIKRRNIQRRKIKLATPHRKKQRGQKRDNAYTVTRSVRNRNFLSDRH